MPTQMTLFGARIGRHPVPIGGLMRGSMAMIAMLTMAGCATSSSTAAEAVQSGSTALEVEPADPPQQDDVLVGRCSTEWGPTVIAEAQAPLRRGAATTRFSELTTSTDRAVQVCDVRGQLEWLMRVHCDDGSHPFSSLGTAHQSRRGNVGPGGPCGHIIDVYEVPCPERAYEVFMDLYVCTTEELR